MRNQGGVRALSWRTVTMKIINSQLIQNFWRDLYSSWIPTKLWGLMELIWAPENVQRILMSSWASQWFLNCLWKVPFAWRLANIATIFKSSYEEDHGNYSPLSFTYVSVTIKGKLFWELLKNIWKTLQSLVTASLASWEESSAYQTSLLFITN